MAKKAFNPFILLDITPGGGGEDSGQGSSHGGMNPTGGNKSAPLVFGPMSFTDWLNNFASDVDGNGSVDFNDYGMWWANNGFGLDAWAAYNSEPFTFGPSDPIIEEVLETAQPEATIEPTPEAEG